MPLTFYFSELMQLFNITTIWEWSRLLSDFTNFRQLYRDFHTSHEMLPKMSGFGDMMGLAAPTSQRIFNQL